MSDLFHPNVDIGYLTHVFDAIKNCPQHTFLIFTKRPEQALKMMWGKHGRGWRYFGDGDYHPNIQFILSLSTQKEADEKIPILLQIPAAVRGLSLEPLLEDIDIESSIDIRWQCIKCKQLYYADKSKPECCGEGMEKIWGIDWVIIGCESLPGLKAGRFMGEICNTPELESYFYEATRNLIGQCQTASVPIYVKQLPINGKVSRNPKEWPDDLRIQQEAKDGKEIFPNIR